MATGEFLVKQPVRFEPLRSFSIGVSCENVARANEPKSSPVQTVTEYRYML